MFVPLPALTRAVLKDANCVVVRCGSAHAAIEDNSIHVGGIHGAVDTLHQIQTKMRRICTAHTRKRKMKDALSKHKALDDVQQHDIDAGGLECSPLRWVGMASLSTHTAHFKTMASGGCDQHPTYRIHAHTHMMQACNAITILNVPTLCRSLSHPHPILS